ncbi:MAG: helicase HerA domain-containing protein [Syntrophales bacterium]
MDTVAYFPGIAMRKLDRGWEATAGFVLQSMLKADLVDARLQESSSDPAIAAERLALTLHRKRTAFLKALRSGLEGATLEMHIVVHPDLACRAHGVMDIRILVSSTGKDSEQVREAALAHFLSLQRLLPTFFPEAEFKPLTEEETGTAHTVTVPSYAVAVHRRCETISLSEPFQRRQVGLLPADPAELNRGQVIRHVFPWKPSQEDWSHLLDMLLHQLDPVRIVVRIQSARLSEELRNHFRQAIRQCEFFLASGEPYQLSLRRQAELIRGMTILQMAALEEAAFRLGVFLVATYPVDRALASVLGQAISSSTTMNRDGNPYQGGFYISKASPQEIAKTDSFPEEDLFSINETAAAFRLPSPPDEDRPGLPLRRSRTGFAVVKSGTPAPGSIELFLNQHQQMTQSIRMNADDRMRHTFLIGQTGTGKSTLMESMILKDVWAGRGVAVIDPHGELVDSLLGKIPPERAKDVVLFDVLDRQHPLGFNILEWSTVDERDLIIDEIYTTLDHLYDLRQTGGPIFEMNLRGMLKLLMGDKRQNDFTPTLLDFMTCYLSHRFRRWLKKRIVDEQVLEFVQELERSSGDVSIDRVSPYITSKFARFVNDGTLRRIIGQEHTAFQCEEIMDTGKIFLVNLGKGRFGPQVSALLANQLVSRFKYAAMRRGERRPEDRPDFFLYVDECHNLPPENFTELLSEARKYRLGLVLATQYTAQMGDNRGNQFLSAVIGNVGTIIIFRLGQNDAKLMAPVLYPHFQALDIIGLPNWQGYARLHSGNDSVPPFSFASRKTEVRHDPLVADEICQYCRLRYGKEAQWVDEQINHRRNYWKNQDKAWMAEETKKLLKADSSTASAPPQTTVQEGLSV